MGKSKAVFLDRDGTINEDPGYLDQPEKLKIFPGIPAALSSLKKAGYLLIVVSNQSGVGRGFFNVRTLDQIHVQMNHLLNEQGQVQIDAFYFCTHTPDDHCSCRKPLPEMLLKASSDHGIDLSQSYMVGDKLTDLQVGRAAKVRGSALVRTGDGSETEARLDDEADFTGDSLVEVAEWILG